MHGLFFGATQLGAEGGVALLDQGAVDVGVVDRHDRTNVRGVVRCTAGDNHRDVSTLRENVVEILGTFGEASVRIAEGLRPGHVVLPAQLFGHEIGHLHAER